MKFIIAKDVLRKTQAAGMNASDCVADPVAALNFNGVATARLVAAACNSRVSRFIYVSTVHVYASPLVGIFNEETSPQNLHPYATSHIAGEHAVLAANQRGQIQGIVVRLTNAYGVPTHKDVNCWMLLVNDLCRQAVQDHKLQLKSNGHDRRDFIPMNEICRVIQHFFIEEKSVTNVGIFNIGSGEIKSPLDMANLIQKRCIHVLGIEPELYGNKGIEGEIKCKESLIIQSKRLEILGRPYNVQQGVDEIDALLRYCNSNFG